MSLPGLTGYTGNGNTTTLEATGTGSALTLANLATVTESANNYPAATQFEALAGGTVTLSALHTINTGTVVLESDGANSVLNVAALGQLCRGRPTVGPTLHCKPPTAERWTTAAWPGLSSVNLTVAGGGGGGGGAGGGGGGPPRTGTENLTLGSLTSFESGNITVSGGATLKPPAAAAAFAAAGATVTISGSGSALAIGGGILNPPPTSGSGVVINVPQFPQGMTLNLDPNGTFSGVTTFNVGAGAVVNIQGGTYTGGSLQRRSGGDNRRSHRRARLSHTREHIARAPVVAPILAQQRRVRRKASAALRSTFPAPCSSGPGVRSTEREER